MDSTIDKTKKALVQQLNMILFPSMGLLKGANTHFLELPSAPCSQTIHIYICFCQISVPNNTWTFQRTQDFFLPEKWQNEEKNNFPIQEKSNPIFKS